MWQASCELPADGYFYPPTLLTDVQPSATLAQEEIFGPVMISMTFRTPTEAVALANNSRYGLAASLWTENINLALDVAPKLKAGSVWVNCTNVFDAAAGFGGYRESGFGREGGKEGLYEYVKPFWESKLSEDPVAKDSLHRLGVATARFRANLREQAISRLNPEIRLEEQLLQLIEQLIVYGAAAE